MQTAALIVAALLTAAPAAADSWSNLYKIVQRVRVGDIDNVEKPLAAAQRRGHRLARAAASFVLARVHAQKRDGEKARAAFKRARSIARISAPAYRWAEVEVLLAEGKDGPALAALGKLRSRFPKFRWAAADLLYSRLQERVARPEDTAATALKLYRKSHLHLPQDELLDRAARMLKASAPKKSAQLFKQLVIDHPESPLADKAIARVGELTNKERMQRVERLFGRRNYEACRIDAEFLWRANYRRAEIGFYLGKIGSERLRDDYKGAEVYLRAAVEPGAPFELQALSSHGIVLDKLGRTDEAVKAFDTLLARFPDASIRRRVEAHYDRGRALHRTGRSAQAGDDIARFLRVHKRGFDWGKYWWFAGFWAYMAGDYAKAIERFEPLLSKRNPLVGGKARYWRARALHHLGKKRAAIDGLAKLVRSMPLTYYAALAEQRLTEWGAAKRIPRRRNLSRWPAHSADPFRGLPNLAPILRLKTAVHLGEPDTTRRVFKVLRKRLLAALGPERFERLEVELADAIDRFHQARKEARSKNGRTLRRRPTRRTVDIWRAIYPRAYRTHVVAAAKRASVPEWMVYSHMLQESRYNPTVISRAPAYGVLQLLDRTAKRLAADAGEDYQLWMAMRPDHNIRWGVRYLGALVKKFYGQLPFAVASYNGGPMLLERHMNRMKGKSFDVMIDDLGPHESRNYTRKVIEHFLRYLALYETPERAAQVRKRLLPAKWTAKYRKLPDY